MSYCNLNKLFIIDIVRESWLCENIVYATILYIDNDFIASTYEIHSNNNYIIIIQIVILLLLEESSAEDHWELYYNLSGGHEGSRG